MTTEKEIFNLVGHFTWSLSNAEFFVETPQGNLIWSDHSYDGDNTLRQVDYNYHTWCRKLQIPFGRDKGKHLLKDYCIDLQGNLATIVLKTHS